MSGMNKLQLVPFNALHIKLMKLREADVKELASAPDFADWSVSYFEKHGFGYTAVAPEGVVGAAGLVQVLPGNWEAWAYTTDLFPQYGMQIHRIAKNLIKGFWDNPKVRRIQCTVNSTNKPAMRWAEKLFDEKFVLEKYGSEGEDFYMFSKVKR
jgi:RimJ/RimL family protein N-acetyltransferase